MNIFTGIRHLLTDTSSLGFFERRGPDRPGRPITLLGPRPAPLSPSPADEMGESRHGGGVGGSPDSPGRGVATINGEPNR
jgi:hypothetical protein